MIQRYVSIKASLILVAGLVRRSKSFSTTTSSSSSAMLLSSILKDPSLLDFDVGKDKTEAATFDVFDPATPGATIAKVPIMTGQDSKDAIQRCYDALPQWRDGTTASHRSKLLQSWSQLIQQNIDDVATIMTYESGKPLAESRGEVLYGTSFLDYYAAEALRPTSAGGGTIIPTPFFKPADSNDSNAPGAPRGQVMAIQQAVGVCALITPWNFPIAMITRKAGPALAVGCTTVMKPSELTPLTAIALKTLANRAGIPDEVFQLITADAETTPEVGKEFSTNPKVKKISFTGSTNVGKLLMKQSSDTVKRLSLELGGNAPFIVFEDANIDQAVNAAMASKFRHAGQTCVCADRFLVHKAVFDEFVDKFKAATEKLTTGVGPGIQTGTTMGPLITAQAVQNVHNKVIEATEIEGANCIIGGKMLEDELGSPNFYQPTILTNVQPKSKIWCTETFGPVAPIISFETEQEAIELANDSNVGLASYFCTNDLSRVFRFSKQLECGIVGINDGIISTCTAPFGGIKESGLGREGSILGIAEYLETKYMFLNA